MSDFNANLEKLFSNQKSEQKYSEYSKVSSKQKKNTALWLAADVNGDGKISSKDKTAMNKLEKELLKNPNLFDVNGDGGGVFYQNGKHYTAGKLTNGLSGGKYYENGKLGTGVYQKIYYSKGASLGAPF